MCNFPAPQTPEGDNKFAKECFEIFLEQLKEGWSRELLKILKFRPDIETLRKLYKNYAETLKKLEPALYQDSQTTQEELELIYNIQRNLYKIEKVFQDSNWPEFKTKNDYLTLFENKVKYVLSMEAPQKITIVPLCMDTNDTAAIKEYVYTELLVSQWIANYRRNPEDFFARNLPRNLQWLANCHEKLLAESLFGQYDTRKPGSMPFDSRCVVGCRTEYCNPYKHVSDANMNQVLQHIFGNTTDPINHNDVKMSEHVLKCVCSQLYLQDKDPSKIKPLKIINNEQIEECYIMLINGEQEKSLRTDIEKSRSSTSGPSSDGFQQAKKHFPLGMSFSKLRYIDQYEAHGITLEIFVCDDLYDCLPNMWGLHYDYNLGFVFGQDAILNTYLPDTNNKDGIIVDDFGQYFNRDLWCDQFYMTFSVAHSPIMFNINTTKNSKFKDNTTKTYTSEQFKSNCSHGTRITETNNPLNIELGILYVVTCEVEKELTGTGEFASNYKSEVRKLKVESM